ncbi:hypothetical protein MPSEU_000138300 [Mayamaea pseudoterrestris]|nr:hypothetical protein MPSEU_000138300 [Mayamaea pseudoterrestris]
MRLQVKAPGVVIATICTTPCLAFHCPFTGVSLTRIQYDPLFSSSPSAVTFDNDLQINSIEEASNILTIWDSYFSGSQSAGQAVDENNDSLSIDVNQVAQSVLFLTHQAAIQRVNDPSSGRIMLGICASSASQGIETLKSWVSTLKLPRGLLHGMDDAGVPLQIDGGVYIKYNSGGVYTFADIKKSGRGFDSLWKPGDAMLENYDGTYRGVYFQVEIGDDTFRQYLCPLDLFDANVNS